MQSDPLDVKPTHFNAFMQVSLHSSSFLFERLTCVLLTGQLVFWVNWIFLKMSVVLRSTNGMPNCVRIPTLFFNNEPEFADIRFPEQPPCEWMANA